MLLAIVQTISGVRDGAYLTQRIVGIGGACLLVALLILLWRGVRGGFKKLTGTTTKEHDIKRHVFSMIKKTKGIELGELIEFGVVGDIPFARTSRHYFFGDGETKFLNRTCSSFEDAVQKLWIPEAETPKIFWSSNEKVIMQSIEFDNSKLQEAPKHSQTREIHQHKPEVSMLKSFTKKERVGFVVSASWLLLFGTVALGQGEVIAFIFLGIFPVALGWGVNWIKKAP